MNPPTFSATEATVGQVCASDAVEWARNSYADALWLHYWKHDTKTSLTTQAAALAHVTTAFRTRGNLAARIDCKEITSPTAAVLNLAWSLAFHMPALKTILLESQSFLDLSRSDMFFHAVLNPLRMLADKRLMPTEPQIIVLSNFDHELGFSALQGFIPLLARLPFGFKFIFVGSNDRLPTVLKQFKLSSMDLTSRGTAPVSQIETLLASAPLQDFSLSTVQSGLCPVGDLVAADCAQWLEDAYSDAGWIAHWRFDKETHRVQQEILPYVIAQFQGHGHLAALLDLKLLNGSETAIVALAWGLSVRVPAFRRALFGAASEACASSLVKKDGEDLTSLFERIILNPLQKAGPEIPKGDPLVIVVYNIESEAGFGNLKKLVPLFAHLPFGFKMVFVGANERLPNILDQFRVHKYDLTEVASRAKELDQ
ncbi:hypothetical protein HDU81_006625 [Chytriomyces hyalinus]|nr:hypothetical protein HDU81_006625 [Chytriomyces hyalinus]